MQFDFSQFVPIQAPAESAPGPTQLPTNVHFTFYAFQEDPMAGRLFAVQDFELHKVIDLSSPCFIDVSGPHPGAHATQFEKLVDMDVGIPDYTMPPATATEQQKEQAATAHVRMMHMDELAGDPGLNIVTSTSTATYPAVAADCNDTSKIPPPMCIDDASNKRRLEMCQTFWKQNPGFFEGTDKDLTKPLNGTTHGTVDGPNPINSAATGGAQFFVDEALDGFDGYAVYWQYDDANNDGMPDYPMGFPDSEKTKAGQLLLFGTPVMPTRGVIHVSMTSSQSPNIRAELAIFANLDQDSTHF